MFAQEIISYAATQPNTSGAGLAVSGDSLVVKNSKNPRILNFWGNNQVAGFHQLVYGSAGNTTRGLGRYGVDALQPTLLLACLSGAMIQPLETISPTIAGSNVAADVETGTILMGYDDLPGVSQRNLTLDQLRSRDDGKPDSINVTVTGAAVAGGGYTGSELITVESDLLRAGYDYAVLGISTTVEVGAVFIVGPDTGNLRVGCPGDATGNNDLSGFFVDMAAKYGLPLIPVISADNKSNTSIGILANENAISPLVTVHLARLKK